MGKILLSQEEIQEIAKRIGKEISNQIRNEERIPIVAGVLKGSLNFMMEVIKNIDVPIFTDYLHIHSYVGTNSSGRVQLVKDLSKDCEGRVVVLIEDIVDTGQSMQFLINHVKTHNPKKIYVCTLVNKQMARKVPVQVDFKGMELTEDYFVAGFGLDYYELERNVPYVYGMSKEDIENLDKILEKDERALENK